MFKNLDPLLHAQLRLAVMSLLVNVQSAEFNYLLEKTQASKGNLSTQIKKLKAADYIKVEKSYRNNYPLTTCNITPKGRAALEAYVEALKGYLDL